MSASVRIRAAMVLLAVPAWAGASAGDGPREYRLGVRVVFDEGVAAPRTRADELRDRLIDEIRSRACYREVVAASDDRRGPGDLVFKVRIDRFEHVTEHDVSLARRERSDRPADRTRYRIRLRVIAETGILVPGSDRAVWGRPYRVQLREGPRGEWDDPTPRLEERLREDFSDRVADVACRPSSSKLRRWVEEHGGGSGAPAR